MRDTHTFQSEWDLNINSYNLQVWVQIRAYLKGTLGNKCVVLVSLKFKNYGRSTNKSWTRNSRVFRQLLSSQLLPYPPFFPNDIWGIQEKECPRGCHQLSTRNSLFIVCGGKVWKGTNQDTQVTEHEKAAGLGWNATGSSGGSANQLFPAQLSPSLPKRGEA